MIGGILDSRISTTLLINPEEQGFNGCKKDE
jgi:hypothetical protein